jgi:cytochrome c oxidase subunit 2
VEEPPRNGNEEEVARFSRRELAKMFGIGVVASVVGIAIALAIDWFPAEASTQADEIDTLWDVLLILSVPIFVLVMTVAIYSVVRFRARPGDKRDGPPIHGNTKLEIVWVTIPFLIVTGISIYAWIVLHDIEQPQADEMVVDVTGQQFTWHFKYVEDGVRSDELVLPVNRPVKFNIRTADVIHSFWVPEFRIKQDAVRGLTTHARVTPTKTGSWQVVCAELCGIGHATMRQRVRVVDDQAFQRFLADHKRPAVASTGGGKAPE